MEADRIEDLRKLLKSSHGPTERVETHASWLLLTPTYVYKLKKAVHYSFLDFSTREKRAYYCYRELELNRRLCPEMYLGVVRVIEGPDGLRIRDEDPSDPQEELLDHAVKMVRHDLSYQMSAMLKKGKVHVGHIHKIARQVTDFHGQVEVIRGPVDVEKQRQRFNDILEERNVVEQELGKAVAEQWDRAVEVSDAFLDRHYERIAERGERGMIRDGHGDLHSGNIFLLDEPVIFDCIEFNDEMRQIDVLDEIAFFCMDLEAYGRYPLARAFTDRYQYLYPVFDGEFEEKLFLYYKLFRANIRAKVGMIRLEGMEGDNERKRQMEKVGGYINLMDAYMNGVKT